MNNYIDNFVGYWDYAHKINSVINRIVPYKKNCAVRNLSGFCGSTFGVDNDWIIKFPRTPFEFDLMRAECRVAKLLADADLPVEVSKPVIETLPLDSGNGGPYEICYEIMPKIRGFRPKECTPGLAREIGEFLGALHNVKVQADDPILQSDWNTKVWGVLNGHCRDASLRQRLYHSAAHPFYQEYMNAARPALCHLDIHLGNLLVDKRGHLSAVIDFGGARITDHSFDKPCSSTISHMEVLKEAYQTARRGVIPLEDESGLIAGRKVLSKMETAVKQAIYSRQARV